jgi:arylsulfatase A-like enzyme
MLQERLVERVHSRKPGRLHRLRRRRRLLRHRHGRSRFVVGDEEHDGRGARGAQEKADRRGEGEAEPAVPPSGGGRRRARDRQGAAAVSADRGRAASSGVWSASTGSRAVAKRSSGDFAVPRARAASTVGESDRLTGPRPRAVIVIALILSALWHLSPAGTQVASAQTGQPPNVLVFVTDDQRATETMWVMPHTRRYFERGGVKYPNAFAVTPLCCPSRATILTGRYAHNTGVWTNGPKGPRALEPGTLFPRLLGRAGYGTAMVGKFLNRWPLRRAPPHFDHWASGASPHIDPVFNVNGTVRTVDGYSTSLVGWFATRFLRDFEANDAAPWLLYVAPHSPHFPWVPAARHRSRPVGAWSGNPAVFEADRSDKPSYVRSGSFSIGQGRSTRRAQLRMLMSVDDMVGRVFDTLRRLGETRRTLAIFTSDNGYLWTEHHLGGDGGTGGQKRAPYTQSIQVPLFLRWPTHVTGGSRDGRLTGTVDIAPTVLDAAGLDPDPERPPLDGRSLLSSERRTRIVLEYRSDTPKVPTWASTRTRRYQYIEYYRDGRRFFREYYNLIRDPWQLRNLLHDGNPGGPDVAAISARLQHDRRCVGTTGRRACP